MSQTTNSFDWLESTELLSRARAVLRSNDTGLFIKPGPKQYPHQWNWDTAFVVIGLAHYNLTRAQDEIRALLRGQWRDGLLPHIVYHTNSSDYFPTPDFWQTERNPDVPSVPTSGLTQPPLLATAVRLMHDRASDRAKSLTFLREIYPALLGWHRWLHTARDLEATGLVAIIHPWESGTDNATRWTAPLARLKPVDVPAYQRKDHLHVPSDERPTEDNYQQFIYLIRLFRQWRYEPTALYTRSPFLVQDVAFNALLYRADEDLRALAVDLEEPTAEIDDWLAHTRGVFTERLWDPAEGLYFDFDLRTGGPIRENTCATFIPLFAGLPDAAAARRLIEEHLLDPWKYAPDWRTRYYLSSTAKDSPLWEPRRYWRGPIWVVMNWLLIQGLKRYGYFELGETIHRHTLDLIARSGFWEYYDPRDGSGCGSNDFSWTAALAIDLLLGTKA